MVTFRNNNRRNNFKRNDRGYKNNISDKSKFANNLSGNGNFSRKNGSRNNINAPKLFEKYSNLAREALSAGDKILSENYLQHADHFQRILNEKNLLNKSKLNLSNENTENLEKKDISEEQKPISVQSNQSN